MFVRVKRPRAIRVRSTSWRGETETFQFEGVTARAFLHELDHLDGVTFVQRASLIHLEKARSQMKKLNRQKRRNAK
jgi:peptide deformylase